MTEALQDKLKAVSKEPGVYLFKDAEGVVLYVGKAINLRNRVRSYFNASGDQRYSVQFLRARIADLETIVTHTNTEAVLLENTLIKKHKPRYNIQLRDDKDYVSVRLNVGHTWPMLTVMRRPKPDADNLVFGPYANAGSARETLDFLKRNFPLRTCSDHVLNNRSRPCLEYQIKRCVAPCVDLVTPEAYRALVDQVILFLRGRNQELVTELEGAMGTAAEAERFEEAARLRDRLAAVRRTLERQKVFSHGGGDRDVFGLWREGDRGVFQVLTVRNGQLVGSRAWPFQEVAGEDSEVLETFLIQYYAERTPPRQVLLPLATVAEDALTEILSESLGSRVEVRVPQRGEKSDLVQMACDNARTEFKRRFDQEAALRRDLESLTRVLGLAAPPARIECVDLSTISGSFSVGAVVTFLDGGPATDEYRHYKIRETEEVSDFAYLREVLTRRFRRALSGEVGWELPDLLVVDGGRGQVAVAIRVLEDLGIPQLPLAGVAKARDEDGAVRRGKGRSARSQADDRVFVPGRVNALSFRGEPGGLFLLQRIRDEAHRFAIGYHRSRRKKATLRTLLDEVPGVGPARAKALLRAFGSVRQVAAAEAEQLAEIPGVSEALANSILEFLKGRSGSR